MKEYFHRLTKQQFEAVRESDATIGEVKRVYQQPSWCTYPGALDGCMGCWSLVGGFIHGIKSCGTCDCINRRFTDGSARANKAARHAKRPNGRGRGR